MSIENIILLQNITSESLDFKYSEKQKGAGYYRKNDSMHTAIFSFNNFKGSVYLQGTLSLYPTEADWFNIEYDSGSQIENVDSTPLISQETRNFTGNFVWIRAKYLLEEGTISEIRYSH